MTKATCLTGSPGARRRAGAAAVFAAVFAAGIAAWTPCPAAAATGDGDAAAPAGPAAAPPPAAAMPPSGPPMAAPAGPERGLTKPQFIERRREAAARHGRDPDRAAAGAARLFDVIDSNHDGLIDRAEITAFRAAHPEIGAKRRAAPAQQ